MKLESVILSPSSHMGDNKRNTIWTPLENKLFETALAKFDKDTPDRWQKVAEMVPGKTLEDVMRQYKELEDDVNSIEAGYYPKYGYNSNCSTSSFTLAWGNGNEFTTEGYGARGRIPSAAAPMVVVATSRPLEHERKKGVPWTEEEHKLFQLGLKKYGKGDWRNISRNFVVKRTPTQVASHAQKYFIRQLSGGKDKRRASIHDITTVNLNENHISSPEYKTTTLVEQCNQTHGNLFTSNRYGGNTINGGGGGCGGGNGLHESYGAPHNMVFQMQHTYPH
ncbi:transcription factor DIVARICATA-like [Bidens hawaiensis]|uniref:transcription factor DIVARICATA-like n=1 Tax=Bidens hawaiensis TaxID=980011 RepID=UPI00404A5421